MTGANGVIGLCLATTTNFQSLQLYPDTHSRRCVQIILTPGANITLLQWTGSQTGWTLEEPSSTQKKQAQRASSNVQRHVHGIWCVSGVVIKWGPGILVKGIQNFPRPGGGGVRHRVSSAYFSASNGCAEVAVKQAKRALQNNVNKNGELNWEKLTRALLQLRNTPDRETSKSPPS